MEEKGGGSGHAVVFMSAPSMMTPAVAYFHSATSSLAVVPPPPMREMCAVAASDQVTRASFATAHMKPTSSRAIAVQNDRCPFASSAQHAVARCPAGLRLPGDLTHFRWRLLQAV